mgnify:CR=1 FL=1
MAASGIGLVRHSGQPDRRRGRDLRHPPHPCNTAPRNRSAPPHMRHQFDLGLINCCQVDGAGRICAWGKIPGITLAAAAPASSGLPLIDVSLLTDEHIS